MNTRKIIFIAVTGIVVFVLLVLFIIFSFRPSPFTGNNVTPAPTSSTGNNNGPIQLISSTPQDKATNVPITIKPSFLFNVAIDSLNPVVVVNPTVPFTAAVSSQTVSLTFQEPLTVGTNYIVTVKVGTQTFFTSFTTTGPVPTNSPDTRPIDIIDEEQEALKNSRPDVYLSNYTPFTNSAITVSSSFVPTPTGHFQFTVKSNSSASPQNSFTSWAKEKGLNDAQITRLDVVYQ